MADFPALEPIARSYGMGGHIISRYAGQNGDETYFLHSALAADVPIDLELPGLTESQAAQILDHYTGQRGDCLPFKIPPSAWLTHSSRYDVVLSGMSYRYAGPPPRRRRNGGLLDVSVSIVSHYA